MTKKARGPLLSSSIKDSRSNNQETSKQPMTSSMSTTPSAASLLANTANSRNSLSNYPTFNSNYKRHTTTNLSISSNSKQLKLNTEAVNCKSSLKFKSVGTQTTESALFQDKRVKYVDDDAYNSQLSSLFATFNFGSKQDLVNDLTTSLN
ncbi:uncharacterized protein SPAPADRAFT_53004 [Spathaspora passalidarum NRRL Y-27907]|uniref:Uncharacterized protein n=1 Tax=Spathaspora passalidarum (strain NRRL Y-27907 / 11-Y1) TaxID=619300 RepID=G3AVF9_SPAPN|nr:uncharacterized protein SPAPADRAFT_53004 [Spathaspora passalidarum NRRL Y-27907]EGW30179.1 hypothetical protein SPAPADRAFT_53004 [Spathaspora passalidarum NRRL Y-27907]